MALQAKGALPAPSSSSLPRRPQSRPESSPVSLSHGGSPACQVLQEVTPSVRYQPGEGRLPVPQGSRICEEPNERLEVLTVEVFAYVEGSVLVAFDLLGFLSISFGFK